MDNLYDMKLHDEAQIDKYTWVQRVPGGWIYRYESQYGLGDWNIAAQFVPFDNEFQEVKK